MQRLGLLSEVGLGPIDVMLVPLERQVAEKLHAYSLRYNGESTRVRDLVDLIIIRLFESLNAQRLSREIERTFRRRGMHPMPDEFPAPPTDWARAYSAEARAVGIPPALADAHEITASWLYPVLQGTATGTWDPERQRWGRT